jgi:hypothetical protein
LLPYSLALRQDGSATRRCAGAFPIKFLLISPGASQVLLPSEILQNGLLLHGKLQLLLHCRLLGSEQGIQSRLREARRLCKTARLRPPAASPASLTLSPRVAGQQRRD